MSITVIKRDGTTVPYDGYEIARSIEEASVGLDDQVARVTQLQSELEITLFDGITSEQLDEAVVQVALQNVKDDPAFDTIASRLLVKTHYKKIFGEGVSRDEVYSFHGPAFVASILRGVELELLDARLAELFDLEVLADEIVSGKDVSTQARVLVLLKELCAEIGMALAFISHDLSVIRALCNRVYVLNGGVVVEEGPCETVFAAPQHAYTCALIDAIPLPVVGTGWLAA